MSKDRGPPWQCSPLHTIQASTRLTEYSAASATADSPRGEKYPAVEYEGDE